MNCGIQVKRSEKKTNAQKCKEYRERKKLEEVRIQKKSAQQEIKKPKTDGERSKLYRERQKLKKLNELQQKNTDRLQRKPNMTRAEYMKEYRRKAKLKNLIIRLNGVPAGDHSDPRKTKLIDSLRSPDGSQTSKGSLLVPIQEEVKEVVPENYLEVTIKEVPESEDVSLRSSRALCEGAGPQLVLIKEEVKEVLSEIYVEVSIKEEVPDSEDVS